MIALKWLTVIAAIAVIFVVALDPSAFWLALAGPGSMGLLYLGLANSKQFQEMHSLYRHNVFTWDEIKHIYIDKSRHLISLEYEWLNENINKKLPWWTYIFCHRKDFETTAEIILSKNTGTPHSREKSRGFTVLKNQSNPVPIWRHFHRTLGCSPCWCHIRVNDLFMSSPLRKFLQALPWNQPIELPANHQWKHANQRALLEWRIKARPYNTTVANGDVYLPIMHNPDI